MPGLSKLNLSSLDQEGLPKIFQTLEAVFAKHGVDFYIIGALAKDVWFQKENIRSRATKDIDLAVFISEAKAYDEIKSELITHHEFQAVTDNAYALHTPYGYPIDLLPFGSIEIDDVVEIEGDGLKRVHVNGFKEVYQKGVASITTEEGFSFKIASLASIVLLKLIAFDDRPERRHQDIKDVALILHHYFDIESRDIYDHHTDLFIHDDFDIPEIGAVVLGRNIHSILADNPVLEQRITKILSLSEKHHKNIPRLIATTRYFTIDHGIQILERIKQGMNN